VKLLEKSMGDGEDADLRRLELRDRSGSEEEEQEVAQRRKSYEKE